VDVGTEELVVDQFEVLGKIEVVDKVVDVPVGAGPVPSRWYTFRRCPAPQYSVELSLHVIEHCVIAVGTAPVPNWLSHQHSPPYSRPIYL
jgi:hypothetical protein